MKVPYNDRWDRTRRHLLRNRSVNPAFQLSPIPEEDRSSPDSDGDSLPDLIIEPEPNRHDHPPEFYEGLERRMKAYYRKLFLGEGSDDDSCDGEADRSMGSIDVLVETAEQSTWNGDSDVPAKKRRLTESNAGHEINETAEQSTWDGESDVPAKKRRLTESNAGHEINAPGNQDDYEDNLMDTCETYNDTRHVSNYYKSVFVEDEDHTYTPELITRADDLDSTTLGSEKSGEALATEISKDTESETDEDFPYHRTSTTVAEIHERPERDSAHVVDNGSPVLMPRLLQLSRRVFGRKPGSFNVSQASDEFIRRLSLYNADASKKHDNNTEEPQTEVQRLLSASELTRTSLDSVKTVNTEKVQLYLNTDENNQGDDDIEDRTVFTERNETEAINEESTDDDIEDRTGFTGRNETEAINEESTDDDIEDRTGFTGRNETEAINEESTDDDIEDRTGFTERNETEAINEESTDDDIEDRTGFTGRNETEAINEESTDDDIEDRTGSTERNETEAINEESTDDDIEDRTGFTERNETEPINKESAIESHKEAEITGFINTTINWNKDGDDTGVGNAIRKGVFAVKARKRIFTSSSDDESVSDVSESFDDEPIAHSSAYSLNDVEVMRDAVGDGSERESWHGEANQDSPSLAFETQADADKLDDSSSDSTQINASFEEVIEDPDNSSDASCEEETAEDSEGSFNSSIDSRSSMQSIPSKEDEHEDTQYKDLDEDTKLKIKKIIDEFWSVSSIDVDLPEEHRGPKRRTNSEGDSSPSKRQRELDIPCSEDNTPVFVGTPLIYRLCDCKNHVCS